MFKIMVGEGDTSIRRELFSALCKQGSETVCPSNFLQLADVVRMQSPDFILFDIGLTGSSCAAKSAGSLGPQSSLSPAQLFPTICLS